MTFSILNLNVIELRCLIELRVIFGNFYLGFYPSVVDVLSFRLFGPALAHITSPLTALLLPHLSRVTAASLSPGLRLSLFVSLFLANHARFFLSIVIMWHDSMKPLRTVFLLDV